MLVELTIHHDKLGAPQNFIETSVVAGCSQVKWYKNTSTHTQHLLSQRIVMCLNNKSAADITILSPDSMPSIMKMVMDKHKHKQIIARWGATEGSKTTNHNDPNYWLSSIRIARLLLAIWPSLLGRGFSSILAGVLFVRLPIGNFLFSFWVAEKFAQKSRFSLF